MIDRQFTPRYITMAKAATEIQAMRPPFQNGDVILFDGDETWILGTSETVARTSSVDAWIPCLDQLMVLVGLPDSFDGYATKYGFNDWHELALAVVMRERFGKRWTGKAWEAVGQMGMGDPEI